MNSLFKQAYSAHRNQTVETILYHVDAVQPETKIEEIFAIFSAHENWRAIPVAQNGRPIGLINRYAFLDSLAQPSRRELLCNEPCAEVMNASPLLVEKSMPIHELSGFLSESDLRHFAGAFIITEQGRYIGLGTGQALLREITKAQVEAMRHANPLTGLPGNTPINAQIEHLLQSGISFAVCYADLDNFKPFNNAYGYSRGNELIQFTAKLLTNLFDPIQDFIGHAGGDDFILVLRSKDWEQRCHRALSAFAHTSSALFEKDHHSIGSYQSSDRQGRLIRHLFPTLSVGATRISPESFSSHHEIVEAAETAKKMAKKKPGNSLFIERRHLHQREMAGTHHNHAKAHYG
ncbi:MAG: GGDEF domain-containing protein [Nitrosomonadales bacterium]|nr:GGDEF domain-containing protein [Nitrosomonadales bacterium]